MVASVHPLATNAASAALRRGGNAVDAAIGRAFVLGVIHRRNSGLGGGCFILIRRAIGKLTTAAKQLREATRDMYSRWAAAAELEQWPAGRARATGGIRAGTQAPRQVAAGRFARGPPPSSTTATRSTWPNASGMARNAAVLRKHSGKGVTLLKPDGSPHRETIKQPDLAGTTEPSPSTAQTGSIEDRSPRRWAAGWPSTAAFCRPTRLQRMSRRWFASPWRVSPAAGARFWPLRRIPRSQILNVSKNFDVRAVHSRKEIRRVSAPARGGDEVCRSRRFGWETRITCGLRAWWYPKSAGGED